MQARGTRTGPTRGPAPAGRTARLLAAERRIAFVAHLLDDLVAVPGTRSRVGLDPLIGLIPFLGDLVTAVVGAWIVLEAARFRMPPVVVARMVVNVVVDFVFGIIPFLGDLLDFGFKSNSRNLDLFHRYATDPGADTASHTAFFAGLLLVFVGLGWAALVLVSRLLTLVF